MDSDEGLMMRSITILAGAIGLSATAALAEPSSDPTKNARIMYSAFECHLYALISDDQASADRLLKMGYDAGMKFLAAVEANEITPKDIDRSVPMGVVARLNGPTHDFIIGRIYEGAIDEARDAPGLETLASTKFRQANCDLL